jgi:geranylgeranyl diphosphate synthase type I
MMRYHLGWVDEMLAPAQASTGKRLRPLLCLLACEAAGGDPQQALPAASAVELVHNFSLVHDDIQDRSPTRRGRSAVWNLWGMAHGINVGDGLFVLARLSLYRLWERGVSPLHQLAMAAALDHACLALCEGQYFDMSFETRTDVGLGQYLWMIRNKTAALLGMAAQLGAMLVTDDARLIDHYYGFGENLGMAFQIEDDILGIWGDERITGKSAATDVRDRKKTLPVVYALNQTEQPEAGRQLAQLYAQPGPLEPAAIHSVLEILEQVRARAYAQEVADGYFQLTMRILDEIVPDGTAAGRALRELAESLVGRQA